MSHDDDYPWTVIEVDEGPECPSVVIEFDDRDGVRAYLGLEDVPAHARRVGARARWIVCPQCQGAGEWVEWEL